MASLGVAIEKVSRALFAKPVLLGFDYWASFDTLWDQFQRDEQAKPPVTDENRSTLPILLMDSRKGSGEWTTWAAPIDWVFAHLANSAGASGPAMHPKYLVWQTSQVSPSGAGGRLFTVFQNAIPWVTLLRPSFGLAELLQAIQNRPTESLSQQMVEMIAHLRLAELLSPRDRHHISNLIAPLLILEGLVQLSDQRTTECAAFTACRNHILKGERGRALRAVAIQLNAFHEVLHGKVLFDKTLFDTSSAALDNQRSVGFAGSGTASMVGQQVAGPLSTVSELPARVSGVEALALLPERFWSGGPLWLSRNFGILLVDDQVSAGYAPILQQLFLGSCRIDPGRYDHEVQDGNLRVRFNATPDVGQILKTLTECDSKQAGSTLPGPIRLSGESKTGIAKSDGRHGYELLLLDVRLRGSDYGETRIEQLTGVKVAQDIARLDPSFPVVLFSSTQQQKIYELFNDHPSIVTDFRKPALTGYEETLDPRAAAQSLVRAAQRALSLSKMRFLYHWMTRLSKNKRWKAVEAHDWKQRVCQQREAKKRAGPGLAHDSEGEFVEEDRSISFNKEIVDREMLDLFRNYLQRGRYKEALLYCYQVIETKCDGDLDIPTFIARAKNARMALAGELLAYCSRCRNLSAHGLLEEGDGQNAANLEDEAIFSFAVCLVCIEQLMLSMSDRSVASGKRSDAPKRQESVGPVKQGKQILTHLFQLQEIVDGIPGASGKQAIWDREIRSRVLRSRRLWNRERLAGHRAESALELWSGERRWSRTEAWKTALESGPMVELTRLWFNMLADDVRALGISPS